MQDWCYDKQPISAVTTNSLKQKMSLATWYSLFKTSNTGSVISNNTMTYYQNLTSCYAQQPTELHKCQVTWVSSQKMRFQSWFKGETYLACCAHVFFEAGMRGKMTKEVRAIRVALVTDFALVQVYFLVHVVHVPIQTASAG